MNASLVIFLLTAAFALATRIEPWFQTWQGTESRGQNALAALMGDSRRMFSNHFFAKADAYFHSGYYPSIFDEQSEEGSSPMASAAGAAEGGHACALIAPPLDWIDSFNRKFFPSEHTHLGERGETCPCGQDQGDEEQAPEGHAEEEVTLDEAREILPWLRMSVGLDPHRVESYVVAAYWLRDRMGRVDEAEQFLREGLRANPDSHEILFDLGRMAKENRDNPEYARRLWELSLAKWKKNAAASPEPDLFFLRQILSYMSALEEEQGNIARAIELLEMASSEGQRPDLYAEKLSELRTRLTPRP